MAKFDIYSSLGVKKAEGYLTFTGTYMKAGVLDFREIGSPTPIDWAIGDYVDYTRTGMRYYLYTIPPVKRQTRNSKYGGAFLYQNVQFHDASYDFEICPFRDLVVGDNRVHFSTQPAISVFDNVAGIAERLGACLDDMYPGKWVVRVASGTEYDSLMAEDRDFSVSGVSIKGALDKVYEVWPEVGWVYSYEQVNGVWKNVLTIGGAGLNTADSYQYSKGNGLTSLVRTVANGDELANRLYVYGSNRNMLPRWYNSQNIKDADSVDIQHLMLPVNAIPSMDYSGWGKTNVGGTDKPDPAKAYIEDATSIAARGLRPKTVYFDGSGDYKEIYPSIREMTMGKIRTAKQAIGDTSFVPAQSWAASDRADTILSVNSTFDDGMAANRGKDLVQKVDIPVSISNSSLFAAGDTVRTIEVFTSSFTPSEIGKLDLETILDLTGTITLSGINYATLWITVKRPEYQGDYLISEGLELERSGDNTFSLAGASFPLSAINITTIATCEIKIKIEIGCESQEEDRYATTSSGGNISFNVSRYRNKSFSITLRQIGFDIDEQSELGNGKTIAMRSGNCVGRSFRIAKSTYIAASDTWKLDVIRSNDESLSQWFPNSSYPIQAGDEFVLLDIAMPELYVYVAEERLLEAAQSLLEDTSKEQWQYNPEIDAKFMVDNSRTIMAANIINLVDANLVSGSGDFLVDSVTINEGESTIPTYKVTLRDKKKKTYSDKASIAEASSNPVSTPSQVNAGNSKRVVYNDSFFEVYTDETFGDKYAIKLKEEYAGLFLAGFLSAAGLSSSGSSQTDLLDVWVSLSHNTDEYANWKIDAHHFPLANGGGIGIDGSGNLYVTTVGGVSSVAGLTGAITEAQLAQAMGIGTIANGDAHLVTGGTVYSYINTYLSSAISFAGVSSTAITNGGTETPTINGSAYTQKKGDVVLYNGLEFLWDGSHWVQFGDESSYALKTITITGIGYLTGGGNLEANRTLDIADAVKTKIEHGETAYNALTDYFEKITVNGVTYVHVKNSYGFVGDSFGSFAGLNSGSGGGGGGDFDEAAMWEALDTDYQTQIIALSHLPMSTLDARYATAGNYLSLNGGTMSNTNLVTNLNADLLDGLHATAFIQFDNNIDLTGASLPYKSYGYGYISKGWPTYGGALAVGQSSDYCFLMQVNAFDNTEPYLAVNNNGTIGSWHQLAYLTSNVASATKLQTSRSLWGRSFDGTADVSGTILSSTFEIHESTVNPRLKFMATGASVYYVQVDNNRLCMGLGAVDSQSIVVNSSGNVGIGTGSPSYKLDVKGTAFFYDSGTNGVYFGSGGNTIDAIVGGATANADLWLNYVATGNIIMVYGGGKVAIGKSSAAAKLDVYAASSVFAGVFTSSSLSRVSLAYNGNGILVESVYGVASRYIISAYTGQDTLGTGGNNVFYVTTDGAIATTKSVDTPILNLKAATGVSPYVYVDSGGTALDYISFNTTGMNIRSYVSSAWADRVYILHDPGRVGILNTSPQYTLDVTGDSHVTTLRIGAGTSQYLEWDAANTCWKLNGNLAVTGFVSSGGVSAGSGSDFDEAAMWEALDTDYQTQIIALNHLPMSTLDARYATAGNYLPMTGGTLQPTSGETPITIKSADNAAALLQFMTANGDSLGYIGISTSLGLEFYNGNDYKIWHAGNDGSGSGLDADLLDGLHATAFIQFDDNIDLTGASLPYKSYGYGYINKGWPTYGGALAVGQNSDYCFLIQVNAFDNTEPYLAVNNNGTIGSWHQLAYLTSNVASATKLQTSRSLWGRSFDGTADVSGTILSSTFEIHESTVNPRLKFMATGASVYYVQVDNNRLCMGLGAVDSQSIVVNSSGNVGIGTGSPSYKLDVNGASYLNGSATLAYSASLIWNYSTYNYTGVAFDINSGFYFGTASASTHHQGYIHTFAYGSSNTTGMLLNQYGGVTIGSSSDIASNSYKLYVNGNTYNNGTFSASEATTLSSTLTVTGAAGFSSTMEVVGLATFDSGISLGYTWNGQTSKLVWDSNASAWHLIGNFYADGFISSGGLNPSTGGFDNPDGLMKIQTTVTAYGVQIGNTSNRVGIGLDPSSSAYSNYRFLVSGNEYITGNSFINGNLTVYSRPSGNTSTLYVYGTIGAYTSVTSPNFYGHMNETSDARLKTNIERMDYEEAIHIIMALKPSKWIWNDNCTLHGQQSAGLIAQEVQPVMPYAVSGTDYLSLTYSSFVAPVVATLQSHEERIKVLEKEIERLRAN